MKTVQIQSHIIEAVNQQNYSNEVIAMINKSFNKMTGETRKSFEDLILFEKLDHLWRTVNDDVIRREVLAVQDSLYQSIMNH